MHARARTEICSSSPPRSWHSFAQVRRRSCGAMCSKPALSQQVLTTYQTTFCERPLPHTFPRLWRPLERFCPHKPQRLVSIDRERLSPSSEWAPCECGHLCQSDQQRPSVLGVRPWASAIPRFKRRCSDRDGNTRSKSKAGRSGKGSCTDCRTVLYASPNHKLENFNERYRLFATLIVLKTFPVMQRKAAQTSGG